MKTNTIIFSDGWGKIYITPACTSTDLCPEGVLCSSFEKPNEFEFNWDNEE